MRARAEVLGLLACIGLALWAVRLAWVAGTSTNSATFAMGMMFAALFATVLVGERLQGDSQWK